MIISVSRRTDIPRFQFDKFTQWIEAGEVETSNPYNSSQTRRISLHPEDVTAFVFWTRDIRNILQYGTEFDERGYRFYVMCTLTGYPRILEKHALNTDAVAEAIHVFASRFGNRRIIWRYDPVFLSTVTEEDFHRENFARLAASLKGAIKRVIVSLYDPYRRSERRLAALARKEDFAMLPLYEETGGAPLPHVRELLADLAGIAAGADMEMQSCAESALDIPGIKTGACIDGGLIQDLWGITVKGRDRNQRPHCRCAPSVDLGRYGPCPACCAYCYASR
ncbi:MAG: DUF1848 domain-containing protein [Spirochaetaceae bacterium]|jgi:hypothetical protein|nr:DUF1848 domain-containing protein [Spirochaetaceae bacterium]